MWVRIAANYPVWYEVEPMALYRVHALSSSGTLARTAGTIRDVRTAIALNAEHLQPERVDVVTRQASAILADTALDVPAGCSTTTPQEPSPTSSRRCAPDLARWCCCAPPRSGCGHSSRTCNE